MMTTVVGCDVMATTATAAVVDSPRVRQLSLRRGRPIQLDTRSLVSSTCDSGFVSTPSHTEWSMSGGRSRADSCATLTGDSLMASLLDGEEEDEQELRQLFAAMQRNHASTTTLNSDTIVDEDDVSDDCEADIEDEVIDDQEEALTTANEYCRRWAEVSRDYMDASESTACYNADPQSFSRRHSSPGPAEGSPSSTRRMNRCQSVRSSLMRRDDSDDVHTPRRKKMVRFADAMGFDLAQIRHILDDHDYQADNLFTSTFMPVIRANKPVNMEHRRLSANFMLPSTSKCVKLLEENMMCLDQFSLNDMCATGVVRVANVGFKKEVVVRYSLDRWLTWAEARALYVPGSSDGTTDRFRFTVFVPKDLPVGSQCSFAIRYVVNGQEYWDNMGGVNYSFDCVPADHPFHQSSGAVARHVDAIPSVGSPTSLLDPSLVHFY